MRALIIAFVFALGSSGFAQSHVSCPLGKGQDHLTIQRVMMNFGKYTFKADAIKLQAANPASVTNAQVELAMNDLLVVEACADAVINGTTNELLPSKAYDRTGADRDQFISSFKQFMMAFKTAIHAYGVSLVNSNASQPRDLADVVKSAKLVDDLADQAHKLF